ncbi:hypothetical protein ATANTOWER_019485 [Ataeniobius toweri]|uniref:Uncharacterized protein n=1 Tax=Ataeniobius toweri TaxID=208326 RepID=A0ABU7C934_9TELE|nr:hypothetical protein [Ataeniobius toweri]
MNSAYFTFIVHLMAVEQMKHVDVWAHEQLDGKPQCFKKFHLAITRGRISNASPGQGSDGSNLRRRTELGLEKQQVRTKARTEQGLLVQLPLSSVNNPTPPPRSLQLLKLLR